MNMILIDGTDIKRQFLQICSDVEKSLQTQIHVYIMKRSADISNDITKRLDDLKGKAQTTDKLVELEQKKEEIKAKEHKRIKEEFTDLQKWIDMLFKTTFTIDDKGLNDIYLTSKAVHSIMAVVDKEEQRIDNEREILEQQLKKRKEEFVKSIDEICTQIEGIPNDYVSEYVKDTAVAKMQQYREELTAYLNEMEDINKEEAQLDWQQTEFPNLLQAVENLRPFETLWYLIRDKDEKMEQQWKKQKTVFQLDPEEMEKDLKEMEKTANKLVNFSFSKSPKFQKSLDLAKEVKVSL